MKLQSHFKIDRQTFDRFRENVYDLSHLTVSILAAICIFVTAEDMHCRYDIDRWIDLGMY